MIGRSNTGGGSGKLYAIIAVTYPEGSVCTCSNGTKTLKASDTSGKALFSVSTGTWTVNCTDGSKTTSKTVSITENGQVVSITLVYTLYLFKSGSGLQNGFTVNILYGCSDYSASDKEKLSLTGGSSNIMSFSPSVDLSKYSKIYFDMKPVKEPSHGIYFGISSSSTSWDGGDASRGFDKYAVGTRDNLNRGTVSLDVSSVSSKKYVKIHAISGFACYVYNIYCE